MKRIFTTLYFLSSFLVAFAQDQTIKGDLYIGDGYHNTMGYGNRINFLGNSDVCFITQYNIAGNQTEFRFNISDDMEAEDKFVIGVTWAGDNQWYPKFTVQGDGNVGIGTNSPNAKLRVIGGGTVLGNSIVTNTDGYLSIGDINTNSSPTNPDWGSKTTLLLNGQDYSTIGFHDSGTRVDFIRAGQGTIQMGYDGGWGRANIGMPNGMWGADGNVAIGSNSSYGYRLAVSGTIRAQEIKVEAGPWPDYVFNPDFHLRPLIEVDSYIKKFKHLPEVPSAKVVANEGIDLGKMNTLLIKKLEEITLYLIEKDRELKEQQKQLNAQAREIRLLKRGAKVK